MKKSNIIVTLVIVAIVVGASSFIIGKAIDKTIDNTQKSAAENKTEEAAPAVASADSKAKNYEIPAPLKGLSEQIVSHTGFTLSYNKDHNTPNWSAWQLTSDKTDGPIGRSQKFWADESIPRAYRVDYYDYKESGYDRGHMCPAGDMKWSREAMHDCFYMSNMCPQDHSLNAGSWKTLEDACRNWARTEGAIYIVCGPVWKGTKHEVIGIDHRIDVPEGFFKAVLSLRKGHEKAIAFYYDNNNVSQPMSKTYKTVDEIEKITGFDLFYQLDDKIENTLEAKANIKDWK